MEKPRGWVCLCYLPKRRFLKLAVLCLRRITQIGLDAIAAAGLPTLLWSARPLKMINAFIQWKVDIQAGSCALSPATDFPTPQKLGLGKS